MGTLAVGLALDWLLVHRLGRRLTARIKRYPFGRRLSNQIDWTRPFELAIATALTIAALSSALAVIGVDISPVLDQLGAAGLSLLSWLFTSGLRVLLIIAIMVAANRATSVIGPPLIKRSLTRGARGAAAEEAAKRADALAQLSTHVVQGLTIVVGVFMVLSEFQVNIAPLIAGVSVVGIAVGFGAQSLVKDIISGSLIFAENQYSVGDVVEVGGKRGLVEAMNIRRTVLRDLDGIVHMIPHGEVVTASNYTKDYSRVNLDIQVAYKEDLDHVIRVLNRVAGELAWDNYFGEFIIEPPRVLGVNSFDDSGISVKVTGVTKPRRQWDVTRELRRRIKRAFDIEGIEIPFPHRTLFWGAAGDQPQPQIPISTVAETGSTTESNSTPVPPVPVAASKEEWHLLDALPLVDESGRVLPHLLSQRDRVQQLIQQPPTGLFVDLDGTLIPLVPNAKVLTLSAPARQALSVLSSKLHVIVVSGRDVEAMYSIVGLNSVTYAGNHGMQWRERGQDRFEPTAARYARISRDTFRSVRRRLVAQPQLMIELRGVIISVSYRAALDQQAAKDQIEDSLRGLVRPGQWKLERRPGAIELVPDIQLGRFAMVNSTIERYGLKSAIAFGDDTLDTETFRAIQQSEATTQTTALTVAVGRNAPGELLALSDCHLRDPEEAELFLSWLAREML